MIEKTKKEGESANGYERETTHHVPTLSSPPTVDVKSKDFCCETFKRLNIGKGITTSWKPAQSTAFKIDLACPPLIPGVVNETRKEKFVCQTTWTQTFVENHMAFAAAGICAQMVSVDMHFKAFGAEKYRANDSLNYHYHTKTLVRAKMSLQKQNLVPEDDFKNAIGKALENENISTKHNQLVSVLDTFGYFWAKSLNLGE
ncbi:hypothetical protein BC938DRAFT_471531 [Jimgerdemannia flammicorona]|uniref:Uncharacterized protein n=1 Tax=Jimgerdemannia flammicorona TaxID=994334 RepID=A0A433Q7W0_9FUNG|nr:hypothetical protein BC938DRAFT_471531 [Jimgerdemannia flammicorona]